jgi:hypothetical protein
MNLKGSFSIKLGAILVSGVPVRNWNLPDVSGALAYGF